MELNDVIKELEELKTRVSELENRITKEEVPDISGLDWVKYVATNRYGEVFGFDDIPIKGLSRWFTQENGRLESITEKQAFGQLISIGFELLKYLFFVVIKTFGILHPAKKVVR